MLFYHSTPKSTLQERLDIERPAAPAQSELEGALPEAAAEQTDLAAQLTGGGGTFEVDLTDAWAQP